jgi:surface polysaccharide O-acyltransferase-like enzyme
MSLVAGETKMRLIWADVLKITAILGVILLHVSAPFLVPFEDSSAWWIGNVYDSFSRWCVPLFVMISGTLVLPSAGKIPLRTFLFVRVRRILLPFLAWSVVYFLYRIHVKGEDLPLFGFFRMLLTEPIFYHLWFVYMLIVLYLFAPAASVFLNRAPAKHVWYLIALWFLWASLLPIIDRPFDFSIYYTPDMDDYAPLKLSGYFLLGYALRDRLAGSLWGTIGLLGVFVLGGAATVFGTYFMSRAAGQFHPFFYKYFSVTVVAMTVSLFLLVKSVCPAPREIGNDGGERIRLNLPRALQVIGMSIYGVYLIHALVLELIRDGRLGFTIDPTCFLGWTLSPAMGIPVFALTVFVISIGCVMVLRGIAGVRDVLT